MFAQRLNAAEKDLEKFIKFLAMKSTQVVVQSRLGEKIQTQCNPLAGNDWFNIVVQDHPDVYDETKRALALNTGDSILQRLPLCIEISLKTVEGDQMILEVWSLELLQATCGLQQQKDERSGTSVGSNSNISNTNNSGDSQMLRAAHAIYNRMGIMLKSLISLTRATPAYKLSRRQCPESYSIYYRIFVDRPQLHTLGEGHKYVKIGQLNTIVGSLVMSVAYRTKMTITPTATEARNNESNTIMLKSDHFRPTDSTTPTTQQIVALKKIGGVAVGGGEKKFIDIEKPLRPGAFTDIGKLHQYTEDDYVLPETPPFEWLLKRTRHESNCSGSIESLNNHKCESPSVLNVNNQQSNIINNNANLNNNNSSINNLNLNNNSAAFKSFEKQTATASSSLTQQQLQVSESKLPAQQHRGTTTTNLTSPIKSLLIPATVTQTRQSATPTLLTAQQTDDENLLKELHFPFASPTSHVHDLAKFYRDCYNAPPLHGLNDLHIEASNATGGINGSCATTAMLNTSSCSDSSAVDDLSRQLEQFETSLEDYDKLVSQLGLTTSSSTGSRSSGGLQMSN